MQLFNPNIERIKTLDVTKGAIILFVVVFHTFKYQGSDNTALGIANADNNSNILLMGAYLCLMLFFIISGYLFNRNRTIGQNLKRNAGRLFVATAICILVLPLILAGFVVLNGQTPDYSHYLKDYIFTIFGSDEMFLPYGELKDIFGQLYVEHGYYFLLTMVTAFFFFYPFAYRFLDDDRKAVASIFIFVSLTFLMRQFLPVKPPFYLDIAPIAAAFMMFGALMAKKKVVERMEERGLKNPKVLLAVVASLIAAVALVAILPPTGMCFHLSHFGEYDGFSACPFFIEALLCCFVGFFVFTIISKIPVFSDFLALFGRHSLGILLLSTFVTKCIASFFYTLPLEHSFPVMSVTSTVCILVVTFILDLIIVIYGRKLIGRVVERKATESEA